VSLHLVRIGIDPQALAIFAAERRLSDDDAGYALHAALAARFGEAAPSATCPTMRAVPICSVITWMEPR
jgi:hypothetical protein